MKQITAEDVRLLQKETGEGMMACKKILVERYKAEEKKEILSMLYKLDIDEDLLKVLGYLVRNA
jgi:hypothetical protein